MATTLENFRLNGQVAVVTGASRGIGEAMAVALAEAGADVALVARGDLSTVTKSITALGRKAIAVSADIGAPDAAERILAAVNAQLGAPTILVNNAGIIRRGTFLEFTDADWDDVLNVNLRSIFKLSQRFAADLVKRRAPGKIINTSSLLSFQGGIRVVSYAAAKSALGGLTRAMANELAPLGINVNAIAPGYIETDNTAPLRADPVRHRAILERIPAGRWGGPDDLKGAVVFLASSASNYVHGITLPVDGGWLSR
ncbi:MAG: hypothetical protein JWM35_797 [Verrucomicrobia bacterium]|nr:hypothetical protein [Verrucomicrobiota bacterium]